MHVLALIETLDRLIMNIPDGVPILSQFQADQFLANERLTVAGQKNLGLQRGGVLDLAVFRRHGRVEAESAGP
jgi:hypothetical protein